MGVVADRCYTIAGGPIRSDPIDLALRNIERLVQRDPVLRDILHPHLPHTGGRRPHFVPAVDVIETEGGWALIVELPGVPKDQVHVKLEGSRLTISGDKPHSRSATARVRERESGPFSRTFLVPFQVDPGRIRAHLEHGLLTVDLPRDDAPAARSVPID